MKQRSQPQRQPQQGDEQALQRAVAEPRLVPGLGAPPPGAQARQLSRLAASRPAQLGPTMRQLQRAYGNRHVAGLLSLAREEEEEERPSLRRATVGEEEQEPVQRAPIGLAGGEVSPAIEGARGGSVRAKLTAGAAGDKYEDEADQVARAVMRQEQTAVQRQPEEERGRPSATQMSLTTDRATPLLRRSPDAPTVRVGPVRGEGGLVYDSESKRLSIIINSNDTLRSIAKKLLPLWRSATGFKPEGATTPTPVTQLSEERLAKGLLVYNRYYLAVPIMSKWKVGLRFPLPVEVNQQTGERTLNPDLIAIWATSFDTDWTPLLTQKPSAVTAPSTEDLQASVASFLKSTPSSLERGITLSARAMTNALEAEPFIIAVFKQLGSDAFETALAFMDELVVYQFDLLASQRPGLSIIRTIQTILAAAPATSSAKQKASLQRSNGLLNRLGVFSREKAETFRQIYVRDVPGSDCMGAVYKGMGGLFSKEVSTSISGQVAKDSRAVMKAIGKDTNHMDRITETVYARGKAGPLVTLQYNSKTKAWEPDPKTTVLAMTHPGVQGWYFFGLSLHAAYHSVILAVDKTDPANPQIYWMDQSSHGFTNNVTGRLPAAMKGFKPGYGFSPSKLWLIMPAADTLVELQ